MKDRGEVERLTRALLETPGHTDRSLRRAVQKRAFSMGCGAAEEVALPPVVREYVDRVARHAYQVSDQDLEGLEDAGYSQDAIFEITVNAAAGAALARLDRGLRALGASP